jgi:hypothetical protein
LDGEKQMGAKQRFLKKMLSFCATSRDKKIHFSVEALHGNVSTHAVIPQSVGAMVVGATNTAGTSQAM